MFLAREGKKCPLCARCWQTLPVEWAPLVFISWQTFLPFCFLLAMWWQLFEMQTAERFECFAISMQVAFQDSCAEVDVERMSFFQSPGRALSSEADFERISLILKCLPGFPCDRGAYGRALHSPVITRLFQNVKQFFPVQVPQKPLIKSRANVP